ncbi:beta-D-glucosyl crocetin beta-1,6-glucosyltransferase-like [Olea europaea var. sylvestris]|uniref:Glycosyltransferase n=1 Tax=Olea europaea subsp. europaea TaxID=158383 RepID=A0A8S0ULK5_OLEEU|nr:beta-D-glucosyl crocetin beta-1,6-glucosyltransferase-like [Olea europaea var. sylvestris]CAA3020999.1 beta-D-glucosyl crocetin beta-1,6-glucosyltransferase-like [Olea europaea subsp. europaea]
MFPWLAHGHLNPYLELAKKLSQINFQIYFCSTAINLSSIGKTIEKNIFNISIQLVELHLPSWPELPPHYHTTKNVLPNLLPKLLQALQMSSSSFTDILSKPDLLLYDIFQPWAASLASSLGIPAVHCSSAGAIMYSFYHHEFTYGNAAFPYEAIYIREHERNKWKNRSIIKDAGEDFAFGNFKRSCDIVLTNSCRAIEDKYIDYFSKSCQKKVVTFGPRVTQADSEEEYSEIMQWLSQKNQLSTVFISFGSENYLSKEQIEEMAWGLELCDVNFIWVVRFPVGNTTRIEETLPEGFLERVKDRGMIVQRWVPQAKILAHQSIGGFVSHCGWSSMVESIYFGVPVIAMPLKMDQPINARLMVEHGTAVEVVLNDSGRFKREEVAKAIKMVVLEKTGEGMRSKAIELSSKMKDEAEIGMNETSEQLLQLCIKYKQKQ